jgi:hypothetical protein
MTQADVTTPGASPDFTALVGALPVAEGAPETPLANTNLQLKDAAISSAL